MQVLKDYYRVLGVLNDADRIVISAAHNALVRHYELSNFAGDKLEANDRIHEINEAYYVLSDPEKRRQYDKTLDTHNYQISDTAERDSLASMKAVEVDWSLALEYHPELRDVSEYLHRISPTLAFTYKLMLLESKTFNQGREIAQAIEHSYLTKYFCEDSRIVQFAKELLLEGNNDAARELSSVIRVIGVDLNVEKIIENIAKKYGAKRYKEKERQRLGNAQREREAARKKDFEAHSRKRAAQKLEDDARQLVEKAKAQRESEFRRKKRIRIGGVLAFLVLFLLAIGFRYDDGSIRQVVFQIADVSGLQSRASGVEVSTPDATNGDLPKPDSLIAPSNNSSVDCESLLRARNNALKSANQSEADRQAQQFNQCKGDGSQLSKVIEFSLLFADEATAVAVIPLDQTIKFPSGVTVNRRGTESVNLAWKMITLESSISTNNSAKNYKVAFKLNRFGFLSGSPEGASNLGYMYQNGLGTGVDLDEAVKWYLTAIDMGAPHSAQAEYHLGQIYLSSRNGRPDLDESRKLFLKAIEMGSDPNFPSTASKYAALANKALGSMQ
jgi:curved DNA-binding protein CbpA